MTHQPTPQTPHAAVGVPGEVVRSPPPVTAPVEVLPDSEKSDIEMLRDQIAQLTQTIAPMTSPGFMLPQPPTRDTSQQEALEVSMTFGQKVWKWGKWIAGIVAVGVGIGIAYQQFVDGNALDSEVEAAVGKIQTDEIEPLEAQVGKNTADIQTISGGVGKLVGRSDAERKVESAQRTFDKFQAEHEILVTEHTAAKAAGQRSRRPTRTDMHVEADDALEKARDAFAKVK